MKLSEAIEHCLVSGMYEIDNAYMCNALWSSAHIGFDDHINSVRKLVDSISKDEYTLWGALYEAHRHMINGTTEADDFAVTSQLYVWWVFDLKRKGL